VASKNLCRPPPPPPHLAVARRTSPPPPHTHTHTTPRTHAQTLFPPPLQIDLSWNPTLTAVPADLLVAELTKTDGYDTDSLCDIYRRLETVDLSHCQLTTLPPGLFTK
jgi:hypothetical protein